MTDQWQQCDCCGKVADPNAIARPPPADVDVAAARTYRSGMSLTDSKDVER
jgi:hypothetical protein